VHTIGKVFVNDLTDKIGRTMVSLGHSHVPLNATNHKI
jgi:hypothetical protein